MKSALTPKPAEELYNLLKSISDILNARPDLREEMKGTQGWINATIGFKTSDIGGGHQGRACNGQGPHPQGRGRLPDFPHGKRLYGFFDFPFLIPS